MTALALWAKTWRTSFMIAKFYRMQNDENRNRLVYFCRDLAEAERDRISKLVNELA